MEKELLFSVTRKDFRVDKFRTGGKGGQNQNTREMGIRITHVESGAVGESREERSQLQNQKIAFGRLVESSKFQAWLKIKTSQMLGTAKTKEQIEEEVRVQLESDIRNGLVKIETF